MLRLMVLPIGLFAGVFALLIGTIHALSFDQAYFERLRGWMQGDCPVLGDDCLMGIRLGMSLDEALSVLGLTSENCEVFDNSYNCEPDHGNTDWERIAFPLGRNGITSIYVITNIELGDLVITLGAADERLLFVDGWWSYFSLRYGKFYLIIGSLLGVSAETLWREQTFLMLPVIDEFSSLNPLPLDATNYARWLSGRLEIVP